MSLEDNNHATADKIIHMQIKSCSILLIPKKNKETITSEKLYSQHVDYSSSSNQLFDE